MMWAGVDELRQGGVRTTGRRMEDRLEHALADGQRAQRHSVDSAELAL